MKKEKIQTALTNGKKLSPPKTVKSLYECRSISELQQIINHYITNLEQLAHSPIVH